MTMSWYVYTTEPQRVKPLLSLFPFSSVWLTSLVLIPKGLRRVDRNSTGQPSRPHHHDLLQPSVLPSQVGRLSFQLVDLAR